MSEQPSMLTGPTTRTHEVRSVRVSLTERGVVFAFTIADGSLEQIRWIARDAVQVRDLARQMVTLAEGMPGAQSACLCELYKPPCPVHQGASWPAQVQDGDR